MELKLKCVELAMQMTVTKRVEDILSASEKIFNFVTNNGADIEMSQQEIFAEVMSGISDLVSGISEEKECKCSKPKKDKKDEEKVS